jgi:hypothetical protein
MAVIEYKELDREYVARQLNGPVIKAFVKAVYNYFHRAMDHHCDYFKNLSIETADTAHLKFIGNLMGLQLFQLFTDASGGMYLVFTDEAFNAEEYDYDNGWAETYRAYQAGDGVFGTGNERAYPVVLTNEQYRAVIEALSQTSSASVDSMAVIDRLVHVFTSSTDYSISYNNGYKDVVNVTLGLTVPNRFTVILQSMFDRLFNGASNTILVTHI